MIRGFATEEETRETVDAVGAFLAARGQGEVEFLVRVLEEEAAGDSREPPGEAGPAYWRSVLRLVAERIHRGRIDANIAALDDALAGRDSRPRSSGAARPVEEARSGEDEAAPGKTAVPMWDSSTGEPTIGRGDAGSTPAPARSAATSEQRRLRPRESNLILDSGEVLVWRAGHRAVVEHSQGGVPLVATFWVAEEDGFPQFASSLHRADNPELAEHWAAIDAEGQRRLEAGLGRRRGGGGR